MIKWKGNSMEKIGLSKIVWKIQYLYEKREHFADIVSY
jgi:hypothetical protein